MSSPGEEALNHELTQRDLDYTPDDGNRYEVIDGELYVTPFPGYAHQKAATKLTVALSNHVERHSLGEVCAAGLKVVLDEPTGVGPDVVYIAAQHMDRMREDGYYGPPDLLIEVVSSKPQLDRYVKLRKYARAGVPHYWIADPENRLLTAYRLEGERYHMVTELRDDAVFRPELFPGLELELGDHWV